MDAASTPSVVSAMRVAAAARAGTNAMASRRHRTRPSTGGSAGSGVVFSDEAMTAPATVLRGAGGEGLRTGTFDGVAIAPGDVRHMRQSVGSYRLVATVVKRHRLTNRNCRRASHGLSGLSVASGRMQSVLLRELVRTSEAVTAAPG